MPAAVRHHLHSLEEYLALERASERKHEFADGQIFLMAGGSPRHNYLAARVQVAFGGHLAGRACFPLASDQRISTFDGLCTYADGSVFCGSVEVGPDDSATNPVVLVEVLSDSTRDYDRGEKLARYKSIPSLQAVMLIEPDAIDVEVWTRAADGWVRRVYIERSDRLRFDGLGVEIEVGEIYEGFERVPA